MNRRPSSIHDGYIVGVDPSASHTVASDPHGECRYLILNKQLIKVYRTIDVILPRRGASSWIFIMRIKVILFPVHASVPDRLFTNLRNVRT